MPLLNAFIDSIASVGFNCERGLIIDRQSEENTVPLLSYLQPYVLAILTPDQAIYPQAEGKHTIDPSYPFLTHLKSSNSKPLKKQAISNIVNNLPIFCTPDGVKISHLPFESRIHHIVFTQEDGKRTFAVVLTFQQKFLLKNEKPEEDGSYQIGSVPIYTTQLGKKKSRPSAYRHTTANPLSNMQTYNSPHTVRRSHYGSSSSIDTDGQK